MSKRRGQWLSAQPSIAKGQIKDVMDSNAYGRAVFVDCQNHIFAIANFRRRLHDVHYGVPGLLEFDLKIFGFYLRVDRSYHDVLTVIYIGSKIAR